VPHLIVSCVHVVVGPKRFGLAGNRVRIIYLSVGP
jgi:hypothetical protein